MGMYDEEVKSRISPSVWDKIIKVANSGIIDSAKMCDIATLFQGRGHIIRGEHIRRGRKSDAHELREILSDWWNEELHDLKQSDAITKLATIFDDRSVQLYPLAKDIRKCKTHSPTKRKLSFDDAQDGEPSFIPMTLKEVFTKEISKGAVSGKSC